MSDSAQPLTGASSIQNQSGGVNVDAQQVNVGGDVVGRDNIVSVLGDNVAGNKIVIEAPRFGPRPGSAPRPPSQVIGREDDLHQLKARLSRKGQPGAQVLTAIRGWPGIGKTTIAAMLAHDPDITTGFPDGVLWTSLGPKPDLFSQLVAWGRALGDNELLLAKTLEETSAKLAALLREKQMLLIIDDVWEVEHAVPFKVGGHGCATLITTRENKVAQALAPTANDIYRLAVLTDDKALELLQVLAPSVISAHPAESRELVHDLEGLPLALQVAGHLLNVEASYGFGASDLIKDLRDGVALLEAKAPADRADLATEATPTIAVLLQHSTDRLDNLSRECYACLSVFAPKPATFDLKAMRAVWNVDDPKPIVRTLVDRGLLEFVPDRKGYQMHALLITHAKSLLPEGQGSRTCWQAHLSHATYFQQVAANAESLYRQGGEQIKEGLVLFDQEWANIQAGHAWAEQQKDTDAQALSLCDDYPTQCSQILTLRQRPSERIAWLETALLAARKLARTETEGAHMISLGAAYQAEGKYDTAIRYLEQRLNMEREADTMARTEEERAASLAGRGQALANLGVVYKHLSEYRRAIDCSQQALVIFREIKATARGEADRMLARRGEVGALNMVGAGHQHLGEYRDAITYCDQALTIAVEIGDQQGQANARNNLGIAYQHLGETRRAIENSEEALKAFELLGDRLGKVQAWTNLGDAYCTLNETSRAIEYYEQAIVSAREIGDPLGEANAQYGLATCYEATHARSQATTHAQAALDKFTAIKSPEAQKVRDLLAEWRA